jgi:hypothetical protein
MSVAKLKITQGGKSAVMTIGMGRDHRWSLDAPVDWFPARSGTWGRGANATKFRQFTYILLFDQDGDAIGDLPEPPYVLGAKFKGSLRANWFIFSAPAEPFDVEPIQVPPPTKPFRIRERWDANVSYLVFTAETAGFEIQDDAGASAFYIYRAVGLSLPIPKLPKVGGGLSPPGPWNDFAAPGWLSVDDFEGDAVMQSPYNLGAASFLLSGGGTISRTVFDFGGNTEGRRGYLVHISDLSTADTYGLPSAGATSGKMFITTSSEQPAAQRRLGGCGKFGCHYSD